MSNVIIVENKVTLKGIVDKAFLKTIFFPKNNPFRTHLSSGIIWKDMAKVGTGLMNTGQQGTVKAILCHGTKGPLTHPHTKTGSVIS